MQSALGLGRRHLCSPARRPASVGSWFGSRGLGRLGRSGAGCPEPRRDPTGGINHRGHQGICRILLMHARTWCTHGDAAHDHSPEIPYRSRNPEFLVCGVAVVDGDTRIANLSQVPQGVTGKICVVALGDHAVLQQLADLGFYESRQSAAMQSSCDAAHVSVISPKPKPPGWAHCGPAACTFPRPRGLGQIRIGQGT